MFVVTSQSYSPTDEEVAHAVDAMVHGFLVAFVGKHHETAGRVVELERLLTAALGQRSQIVALKKENLELKARIKELEAK